MLFNPKKKHKTSDRPKKRDVRKWSDEELVNAFFDDRANRSVYESIIRERMIKDNYANFFKWNWNYQQPVPKKPIASIPETASEERLGRELQAILDSGLPFTDCNFREPEDCMRFCSARGHVHEMLESDLTPAQQRMLDLIRDRFRKWLRQRS